MGSIENRLKKAKRETVTDENGNKKRGKFLLSAGVISKIKDARLRERNLKMKKEPTKAEINKQIRKQLKSEGYTKIKIVNGEIISKEKQ